VELLPTEDERKWLIRYQRKLIERAGAGPFLNNRVLEPTRACFPDAWNQTLADVHRVTQRLMHHAGLGHLGIRLSGFTGGSEAWDEGTAGWFAGIVDGTCLFGVHLAQLHDPEQAAGVMAHEVAHAWRRHHGFSVDSRDREELLTDLTTIYLGFGILTTNNTDRYRSAGDAKTTTWSNSAVGYLPPQSMAWLLAVQAAVRNDKALTAAITKHLEPNQLACFRAAAVELHDEEEWLKTMQFARPEQPGVVTESSSTPFASREPEPGELLEDPSESAEMPPASVYRVADPALGGAYVGSLPGIAAGIYLALRIASVVDYPEMVLISLFAPACAIVTGMLGARYLRRYSCSNSSCQIGLKRDALVCPRCGGTVVRSVSAREFRQIREAELDASVEAKEWTDCEACAPEEPCPRHAVV
jgi:hypothetical protein